MQAQTAEIVSQIWNESRNRIKGFIAKRIDNEADVEDVMQEVFFKMYQRLGELKDPDRLYAWVFQIARNAVIDYYRERKPVVDSSEEILSQIAVEPAESDVEEEILNWLEPMVGDLPEKYREALLLTDIQGLTQKELSEKLDISLSGAKSRVQRAREKLRENLLDCCLLEFNRAGKVVEYQQRTKECNACSH